MFEVIDKKLEVIFVHVGVGDNANDDVDGNPDVDMLICLRFLLKVCFITNIVN